MQKTSNYGLNKPDGSDTVDISVLNQNMDTIDVKLKNNADNAEALEGKVSSHLEDMTAHGIGDRTQLKTTAKDTLVNAVNELFTSASSGKSAIATAAGSPSTSAETFSQLATDITNGKNNIYNAITAKGITPATKNFADLVSSIGNISTGKKCFTGTSASGQSSKIYNLVNGNLTYPYITIPKSLISFTPRIILASQTANLQVPPTFGDLNGVYNNFGTIGHLCVNGDYYVKWDAVCYDSYAYYIPVTNANYGYNVLITE